METDMRNKKNGTIRATMIVLYKRLHGLFIIGTCRVRFILAIMFFFCIMFIIVAPRVKDLGLEVEAFREIMGNSSLGCRVRVGLMCRGRESGISVILLMVD